MAENAAAHRIGEEADEVEAGRRGAGAAERGELSCGAPITKRLATHAAVLRGGRGCERRGARGADRRLERPC